MADQIPKESPKTTAIDGVVTSMQENQSGLLKFEDNRPETATKLKLQGMANAYTASLPNIIQKKTNNTGLPDDLKSGVENLSGHSMDDVKVHYNSNKPAQLNAHAYAQGSEIHLSSGQEKHLPHEAWHVVQQKQGRVKPTVQMKETIHVNDDKGLETETHVKNHQVISNTLQLRDNVATQKVIQRSLSRPKVIQVLQGGADAAFTQDFLSKHNCDPFNYKKAALTHKERNNYDNEVRNTVIQNATTIKDHITQMDHLEGDPENGAYWRSTNLPQFNAIITRVAEGHQWTDHQPAVNELSKAEIEIIKSMKAKNRLMTEKAEGKLLLQATNYSDLNPYPRANDKGKASARTQYIKDLIDYINAQREKEQIDNDLAWVKANVLSINGVNTNTMDDLNNETTSIAIRVSILRSTGQINHLNVIQ